MQLGSIHSFEIAIVFIQSCFTMASSGSGAAPSLPASSTGIPFEIPTPSHSPFQIESRSSRYWPLRHGDLIRLMPEPQRDQEWHVLPAKFNLEPSGDGGHYLVCQYANGWEERCLWFVSTCFYANGLQAMANENNHHQIIPNMFMCFQVPIVDGIHWPAQVGQLPVPNGSAIGQADGPMWGQPIAFSCRHAGMTWNCNVVKKMHAERFDTCCFGANMLQKGVS